MAQPPKARISALRLLERNGELKRPRKLDTNELAKRTGVSVIHMRRTVQQLQKAALIKSEDRKSEYGGPPLKIFHITISGKQFLRELES